MNIFVACWFFPPATSSEGIATYKLLKNSQYTYDVVSSNSKQWGYNAEFDIKDAKNINVIAVQTDNVDEWVSDCIEIFEEKYKLRAYQVVMTRAMPPESIIVGDEIRKKHPEIKWVCSIADPIANSPYEKRYYIDPCFGLCMKDKRKLWIALNTDDEELLHEWENYPDAGIRLLCVHRKQQNIAFKSADIIIAPSKRQFRYMSHKFDRKRDWVIPHSFDPTFYCDEYTKKNKIQLLFVGYSDRLRTLEPLIIAVSELKKAGYSNLNNLKITIAGNNPDYITKLVEQYDLKQVILIVGNVSYYESLKMMRQSDWLIHVDADFPELSPGGSVYFAGKIADYMGAQKPILAITGNGSPAQKIVSKYGGICVEPKNIRKLKKTICIIAEKKKIHIRKKYAARYDARYVAACFDQKIDKLLK